MRQCLVRVVNTQIRERILKNGNYCFCLVDVGGFRCWAAESSETSGVKLPDFPSKLRTVFHHALIALHLGGYSLPFAE